MDTMKQKASYCIGLQAGINIRQQFGELAVQELVQGVMDGVSGTEPKLQVDEINGILANLKKQVEQQQKAFVAKVAEENRKTSEVFFAENKNKEGVETLPSGLQYKVLKTGPGEGNSPRLLDEAQIHYRGYFLDGRTFDSSYQRGESVRFPLNQVIAGWSEILQHMHVGDQWQVFIPPYLAYGEQGFGQHIAPNMALIFEIELLGINESAAV